MAIGSLQKVHMRYTGDGFWEFRVMKTMRIVNKGDTQLNERERIAADAITKLATNGIMDAAVSFMDFI